MPGKSWEEGKELFQASPIGIHGGRGKEGRCSRQREQHMRRKQKKEAVGLFGS